MALSAGLIPVQSVVEAAWVLAHEACGEAGLIVEDAHDSSSCQRVADVLNSIWERPGTEMIDASILVAFAHAGNLVTAAVKDGKLIGAAAGFCGPLGMPFHSHVVGFLPEAVGNGAGRAMKLYQRAWCLERGIDTMTWTYDPLVSRNGYFNIRRLGATVVRYYPDFYGVMTDLINAGQHSDRMLVRWDLARIPPSRESPGAALPLGHAQQAIADRDGSPTVYVPPADMSAPVLVAVPLDIESMRRIHPPLAGEWRLQTRAALTDLLSSGWAVTDFTRSGQYVLRNERTL